MSLFMFRLSCISSNKSKTIMLIGDICTTRLMIYVQYDKEDNLKDKEEFRIKRAKITRHK